MTPSRAASDQSGETKGYADKQSSESPSLTPFAGASVIVELTLLVVLIALNAMLAGTEMALVSLRDSQLARLEQRGPKGQRVVRLAQDPNRFLSTIQIGLTLGGFLASAVAAVALAEPLVKPLSFLGNAAEPVAIVAVTLVLTFFTLVLGELAPKRIAMQRAETWAIRTCGPVAALARVSRPALWILGKATDLVVRLAGADPTRQREEVTADEIRTMIDAQPDITADQREIIAGAFEIQSRDVWHVLVPRVNVVMIPSTTTIEDARNTLVEKRLSRAPVYGTDSDDVIGIVHIRDLINATGTVADAARSPLVVPESAAILDALRAMRAERTHLAIVIDEYGSFIGVVTMEDLLEEIVGDIYDEFDLDGTTNSPAADGTITLPGNYPAHDLADAGIFVEPGDNATLAGILFTTTGRVPEVGERIAVQDWVFEVLAIERNAITAVKAHPITNS
jgi:putative hemolysin